MCFLFGEDINNNDNDMISLNLINTNSDESFFDKAFLIKDFRILYGDGNDKFATAVRGNHFLIFEYMSS
jgi:hypothetical protein